LKALALASNGDYLTHFYGGAAVTVNFTSSVSGKATVTFKIASGYLTYVSSNYTQYKSGYMIVNKIMKFTVNGKDVAIGDDVVLKGDSTTGDYSINGKWTDVSFEIDVKAGNNTIVLTSIFPDDGTGKSLYIDPGKTGTQSSFNLDTMTVNLTSVSYDLTADNDSLVHNFTGVDQTAKNDNNPPSNRVNVSYVSTATASTTAQKATKLATNEDYLGQFYGGAAVTYSFTSSVSGKATITFKISSGYLTKVSGTKYETGDMVVNKVMKITVNGEEIIFGDDVVLNGDKTKQSYACMANWTYLTFEVDLLKGANTIVLTSLYPVDGEGNLLYKDPGSNGTQSSFLLDTVSVALVKPDLSNEVNSFTHNYTTADQSARNNENPPKDRVNVNYVSTAGASATAQLATKLATNEDYLSYFYGGAAVTKTFISTVAGKATVTFKIASGYLTKVQNPVYESGDMVVNKVMKITVNGVDIVIGDDVVLNGDTTTQTYACLANWTYVTFEIDVVEGKNTIVLTSLCPKDENGEPLYKDPGVDGTQSSFHLDTVTVTLK
jgi:hypoxanthine-guanine phosphoribosyltransferase